MSNSSCRLLTGHQRPIRTEARGISAHESVTRRARGHRDGQSESTSSEVAQPSHVAERTILRLGHLAPVHVERTARGAERRAAIASSGASQATYYRRRRENLASAEN